LGVSAFWASGVGRWALKFGGLDSRFRERVSDQGFEVTEICSGSEAGSNLRLIDFVHHSSVGLRLVTKKVRGEYTSRIASGPGGDCAWCRI